MCFGSVPSCYHHVTPPPVLALAHPKLPPVTQQPPGWSLAPTFLLPVLGDSGAASQHPAGSKGTTNTLCSGLVHGESEIGNTTGATYRRLWP